MVSLGFWRALAQCLPFTSGCPLLDPLPVAHSPAVPRQLPHYVGAYDPLPEGDSSTEELLKRYRLSKPTFFKRRDAVVENGWVKPTKVGQRVWYTPRCVFVLDQVAWWCDSGYALSEVVEHLQRTAAEFADAQPEHPENYDTSTTVEVPAETVTTDLVVKGLSTSADDLARLGDDFVEKLAKSVGKAVEKAVPRDVLHVHDFLKKAADNNYKVSGKLLAEGLQLKNSTVSAWPDTREVNGFLCTRVGKGQWKVERVNTEEGDS